MSRSRPNQRISLNRLYRTYMCACMRTCVRTYVRVRQGVFKVPLNRLYRTYVYGRVCLRSKNNVCLSVWECFLGVFSYYCVRKSKAGFFQLSTLIWLVGLSLVKLPHHARSPLWHSCLPGSRSCPGLDLARGRVWCLKSQWMQ